jgi:hypothetical protein
MDGRIKRSAGSEKETRAEQKPTRNDIQELWLFVHSCTACPQTKAIVNIIDSTDQSF